ncbi:hypothetical protein PPERSA_01394 [Pseudocohnilembus persalinus]|uniref:Uncharacterized protein n=1 Tax=Pseudocohnilembus persalinus TaxID=266149 RepID=A0A0V0QGT7_PSEPJ|nr:hypothetical protein PPERSA_01394 [Pseudocohnilembus persalinus]|eukprot:KRX01491.1 hypothetical protein PPERSA_01394 [Pseudocohnilembus persalinus]
MQEDKKKMTKQEKEQQRLEKQKQLTEKCAQNFQELSSSISSNNLQNFQNFFDKTDVTKLAKTENNDLIINYVHLFQTMLSKTDIKTVQEEVLQKLTDKQQIDFFEYLNKSFEMVGKGQETKYHPNFLLQVHGLLISAAGVSIILKATGRKFSLVTRTDNGLSELAAF